MSLISRYILREACGAWLIVILVLFVILMSNQFAEVLGDAAADRLPRDSVFAILALSSLRYLTVLVPIGLFLGIMLALARLNRDSEMAALAACGIGPVSVLRPIGLLAALLAAGLAWLALVETPASARQIEEIRRQAEEEMQLGVVEAGRFTTPDSGNTVVYAQAVDGQRLQDVFLQRQIDGRVVVILARDGQLVQDAATGRRSFILRDGRRYEGVPGEKRFLMMEFAEHGIPLAEDEQEESVEPVETKPTEALLASPDPLDQAELQWRISAPISLFVLALLAVPLSRSTPREGRYARVGAGLLIYVIYANALSIARVWVEDQTVPVWIGMWWVHGVAGIVGLWMLGRAAGWFSSSRMLRSGGGRT